MHGQIGERLEMAVRQDILARLWRGHDPFADFPRNIKTDPQGWNSDHRYLTQAIDLARPSIVVEIGVWKGGSVMTMARRAKELGLDCVIIAIDTWLGSPEHWLQNFDELHLKNGFPQLYYTFGANIADAGLQDYILPLPVDSVTGTHLIERLGIRPNVLHLDAGHEYETVMADLRAWWPLIAPGGILVGDDYYADGITWAGVKQAFDEFFVGTPYENFEGGDGKCIVHKPAT
jgi:hypothetical protein